MIKFENKLIILTGNIGTGKSTITNRYAKEGYSVIARDKLRYMMGNGNYVYNEKLEGAVWNAELKMVKGLMRTGANIIVDEVGINKEGRARYIKIAKHFNYKSYSVVMPVLDKKEAVDRRMNNPHGQNDRKLWEGVWQKFDDMYKIPTLNEGFEQITFLFKVYRNSYLEDIKTIIRCD